MRNFTIFLMAFITLASIVPADAQRRQREAQKQQPAKQQKPTPTQKVNPSSDSSGRREKRQAPKVPLVPCTLTLDEAPSPRGFAFGQTLSQIRDRFDGTPIAITGRNMPLSNEKPFFQEYVLYSNSSVLGNATSPIDEAANSRSGSMMDRAAASVRQQRQREANELFKDIKQINVYFYGANDNPILFGFGFNYIHTLTFQSTQVLKEIIFKNFGIPVGSWTPISEDRNEDNDWDARCNGWRAVFATGVDNTGLYFSATNTDVESNLDAMKRDAAKKKTDETFKP
jgi:hypothetical protein